MRDTYGLLKVLVDVPMDELRFIQKSDSSFTKIPSGTMLLVMVTSFSHLNSWY